VVESVIRQTQLPIVKITKCHNCLGSHEAYILMCLSYTYVEQYNFWLFARDRALQSTFFRTNVIIVYVAAIFSLVSAFCNFSLLSGFIEVETTFGQILGQVLQLLILCIMTALFTRPLLNYALGSWSQTNANIRAVVKRTAVGAVIHGTMSLAFIVLLLAADPIIEAIGFVDWYMLLNISVVVPLMIHISISHRDDKPVLSIVESFRSTSSAQNDVKSRSILQAYMSMAIETLKTESAEIQSSTNTSIDAIQPNPGVSSFTNSSELELSEDDARTSLPSEISVMSAAGPEDFTYVGDSSISSDQVAVTEIFDDTA